jgi:alkylation response protein AidB-like acyl-CoA dehydrogenase
MTLLKWGTDKQRKQWIAPLAKGEVIAAFALTEPGAGSATESIETEFQQKSNGDTLIVNGQKKWISYGQVATLFLVIGRLEQKSVACLVPKETAGLEIKPIHEMLGFRAAGLAEIDFHDAEVPSANIIGKPGFALSHIAPTGLQIGRLSTACSAAGLLRACFEDSVCYAATRKIADHTISKLDAIRTLIAKMGVDLEAAQLLCYAACRLKMNIRPKPSSKFWPPNTTRQKLRSERQRMQCRSMERLAVTNCLLCPVIIATPS